MPAGCVDGGRFIIDGAVVSRGAPTCRKARVAPGVPVKIAAPSVKPAAKRGRPMFFFKDCDEAWLAGNAPWHAVTTAIAPNWIQTVMAAPARAVCRWHLDQEPGGMLSSGPSSHFRA